MWLLSDRTKRAPVLVSVVVVGLTIALIPIERHQFGPTPSYVPAILAAVTCFDILSAWLLLGEYRDNGQRRMLVMAVAYIWSLLVMTGYAMAFPHVVSDSPPLAVTPSVAPYLYLGWHAGFPILLGAAWLPWPISSGVDDLAARARVLRIAIGAVIVAAVSYVVAFVAFSRHLPVLIHGLDTTAMARLTAPLTLPLVVASLVVCGFGVRARARGPERWTFVAILVCLCDLCLTYASRARFSLGWYAGRTLTLVAAAVVLVALLASFRQLKKRAETDAARDSLTGLANRRAAYEALTALLARARRMDTSLSVVVADLDHFKQINDRHGHAAGDAVLRAAATAMQNELRETDLIARIGGEEFLILLPDADPSGAEVTVERIRLALHKPGPTYAVTASFGMASRQPGDLVVDSIMQRADQAMYVAKALGRDQVHSWLPVDAPPADGVDVVLATLR